ncbi:LysR family transcriptional regulator [Aureimonas sp. OT7]|uniref:LysR substrate-binding domain-containing protein n=1 Tax=Aureimonas sp. OT7 TaxID=2816454 RepID=UPI0017874143|nr:LysR substrate-binding domain-containing protein [Aureimonas sp. OT7]QOG06095.1 LysR family transcriptional regulator [Aureimonas sp. OT7]
MDLRQLRYFIGIVEAKSFSRAAISLRVAQPALSLHVRNMEADLGTELLLRTPQGVVPTAAGELLLERARRLVADFEDMKRQISESDNEPAGEVRLGLPGTIGELLSVPLILKTRQAYPRIHLTVAEAMSGFVLEWLAEGRVDLGLLYIPVDRHGLRSVALISEELCLFGPAEGVAGCPPPQGGTATLDEIGRMPLVLPGIGHGLRTLVDAEMERAGLEIATVIDVDSYGAIKELVAQRVGYSILPFNAIAREVEAGRFLSWQAGQPALSRNVHLVQPFDRPTAKAAAAIEALCRETLAELVASGHWRARLIHG